MSGPLSDRSHQSSSKFGRLSEMMNHYSNCSTISLKLQRDDIAIQINPYDQTQTKSNKPSTQIKRKNPTPFYKLRDGRMSLHTSPDNMKESMVVSKQIQLQNGRNLERQMFRQKTSYQQRNIKQLFKKKTDVCIVNQKIPCPTIQESVTIIKRQTIPLAENKNYKINCLNATIQKCQQAIIHRKQNQVLNQINIQAIGTPLNEQKSFYQNIQQSVNSSLRSQQQCFVGLYEDLEVGWKKPLNNEYNIQSPKSELFSSFGFGSEIKGKAAQCFVQFDQILKM